MEPSHVHQSPPGGEPSASVTAVRFRLTIEHPGTTSQALVVSAGRLPLVPFPVEGTSVAEVVAALNVMRTTELDADAKPTWTVVRDDRDGSSGFWDHRQRSWIGFAAGQLAADDFGPYERLRWEIDGALGVEDPFAADGFAADGFAADGFAADHVPGDEAIRIERVGRRPRRATSTATVTVFDHGIGTVRLELDFRSDLVSAELGCLALQAVVGGPRCHARTGFPLGELSRLGCLVRYRAFVEHEDKPAVIVTVDEISEGECPTAWFAPPDGFEPLRLVEAEPFRGRPAPEPKTAADAAPPPAASDNRPVARGFALRKAEAPLTPDCVGSTRSGTMAGVIRQDAFDHIANLLNMIAPLVGTATLAGGTLTVPWLANLAAINAASKTAPGSGLFTLLRDPRMPGTPATTASGGWGVLDRLAWKLLTDTDEMGMALMEREVAGGTLVATLTRWGVSPATRAKLVSSGGTLGPLSQAERIEVVEGYELADLGMLSFGGLPSTLPATGPPYNWNGLITMSVAGIGGTLNFGTIPSGGFVTAMIGSNANVAVTMMLPDATFMATVTRALTTTGQLVTAGIALSCLLNPLSCGVAIPLAATLAFLLNNVTSLTATSTATTVSLDIAFVWDPIEQRVVPQVTVLSASGTISVVNRWVTPNYFANLFESAILGLANLFDVWPGILAAVVATALQNALTAAGIGFPIGVNQLRADDGGSWSAAGTSLSMFASIESFDGSPVQPYLTQVPTTDEMTHKLEDSLTVMHADFAPTPALTPPDTRMALYGGLSLSQNALNYYLYARWRSGGFETTISDPATIAKLGALLPAKLAVVPSRIHLWPAVSPRVEVSMDGLTTDGRPLVVFFDDVRACFEVPNPPNDQRPRVNGVAELSFNFKTTAALTIDWPFVVKILPDAGPFATTASDIRVEEYFDLNDPLVMTKVGVAAFQPLAAALAFVIVNANSSTSTKPTNPHPWRRPTPGITQSLSGDDIYMEIDGLRRVVQLLPVVTPKAILELVDGSGAPSLNYLLGTTAAPVSLATMTSMQAVTLRKLLLLIQALPVFPPP